MALNYGYNISTSQVNEVNAQQYNIITHSDSTTSSIAAGAKGVVGELVFVPQYTGAVLIEGIVEGAGADIQVGVSAANGTSGSESGVGVSVASASAGTSVIGYMVSGLIPYEVYYIGIIVNNTGTSAIDAKGVLTTAQELSTGVIRG